MKLKFLINAVIYSFLCLPILANSYENSGYSDNYVDDTVFEQIIQDGIPSDPYQSSGSTGSVYDGQEPYDRDSGGYVSDELPSEMEQALHVDGVTIDEYNGVIDAEGNYLGQADELYGITLDDNQDDPYADEYNYDEQYADEGYADESYSDDQYEDQYYAEEDHSDDAYQDEYYADENYSDDDYSDDEYADEYYDDGNSDAYANYGEEDGSYTN